MTLEIDALKAIGAVWFILQIRNRHAPMDGLPMNSPND